jgi:hypothetical protein
MALVNAEYIRAVNRASACHPPRCCASPDVKHQEDLHAQVKDALFMMLADTDSDLINGNAS